MSINWRVVGAVMMKDLTAIRRSKAIIIPMIALPALLLLAVPAALGLFAHSIRDGDIAQLTNSLPGSGNFAAAITDHPADQQVFYLLYGYLLAPLFIIVPLMVAAVLAADAFAGEKERHTLEGLLHLPISERDLFAAKVLTALVPAVGTSWTCFAFYCVVADAISWPKTHGLMLPNFAWIGLILWLGPAIAAFGLSVMVRISARARTAQEANQLGGAIILPLIFFAMAQAAGLLLLPIWVMAVSGTLVWGLSLWLFRSGSQRFTRDRLGSAI